MKIKINHATGNCTLANPLAPIGKNNETVSTVEITDIPPEVSKLEVLKLWGMTCDLTWLRATGDYIARGRHTFKFSELGLHQA